MVELGWLSPEGKMYPCDKYDHIEESEKLAILYNYSKIKIPSDELLLKHGWVHITLLTFFEHGYHFVWYKKLSENQKKYLKPIFEDPDELIVDSSRRDWEREIND